jgi:hypothetical protein
LILLWPDKCQWQTRQGIGDEQLIEGWARLWLVWRKGWSIENGMIDRLCWSHDEQQILSACYVKLNWHEPVMLKPQTNLQKCTSQQRNWPTYDFRWVLCSPSYFVIPSIELFPGTTIKKIQWCGSSDECWWGRGHGKVFVRFEICC